MGILLYVLLTGALPWQKADTTDPHYMEYISWKKRKTLKTPKRFSNFTTKALKMFKRLLEPKEDKRSTVKEVKKYIEDKWLTRTMKKQDKEIDNQSVCYSTFSIHSSKIEKDRTLHALKVRGIETTVDRAAKKKRIHEWIERSLTSNRMFEKNDEDIINCNNNMKECECDHNEELTNKQSPEDYQYKTNSKVLSRSTAANAIKGQTCGPISPDRGRIVSTSQLDCSQILRTNSYRSRETLISSSVKSASRTDSFSSDRRPSVQDGNLKTTFVNEHHSRDGFSSSKSQYHESPSRDPHSPLRVQSQSQLAYTDDADEQKKLISGFSDEIRMARNIRHFQSLKLKNSNRNALAVRSHSDRLKHRPPPVHVVSESNNRVSSDYNIQRSKTVTHVNKSNLQLPHEQSSDNTLSQSNDSLTSIIPMAFNF